MVEKPEEKEEKKKQDNKKDKRKPLPFDKNEYLKDPIDQVVEKLWGGSWEDPKAESYKLLDYVNFSLLAIDFLSFHYNMSEGEFGIIRYLPTPADVDIGIIATTYGGIDGIVAKGVSMPTVGTALELEINRKLYDEAKKILEEARERGLNVYKKYMKHKEEKVPEVYIGGESTDISKYYLIDQIPRDYQKTLSDVPIKMIDAWKKRIGIDFIRNATFQMNYVNEFGIGITKTRKNKTSGKQKEIRLTMEGIIDVKDVGEVGEAIGCAGGIDAFLFTHPQTLKTYRGWEAIESLGEWIGSKAQAAQRAEDPNTVFENKKINVIMPGTVIGAAMSSFFSGKKMWEAIKKDKKMQLHRLIGQRVAPADFTMIIDGRQETDWGRDLYGTLEMDSEGVQANKKVIVDHGKLVRFFNSRLYFTSIAEKTALADELLAEKDPLMGTARKAEASALPETVPTNLLIKSDSKLSMDQLISRLGKQKTHLYVTSASLSKIDLNSGDITIRVDQGRPIQAGKVNEDVIIGDLTLSINFNSLTDRMKYIGGTKTQVTHPFNLEVNGSIYEISVTAPYVALFEIDRGFKSFGPSDVKDLFTSQHLYTKALPNYLTEKRKCLRNLTEAGMPPEMRDTITIWPPFMPMEYVRSKLTRLEPIYLRRIKRPDLGEIRRIA